MQYKIVTGDISSLADEVSTWLAQGWALYGSPMMTTYIAQAMIKKDSADLPSPKLPD